MKPNITACIILFFIIGIGLQTISNEMAHPAKTGYSVSLETGTLEQITPHFIIDYHNSWPMIGTKNVGDMLESGYSYVDGHFDTMPDKISAEIIGKHAMTEEGSNTEAFSISTLDKIVFQEASFEKRNFESTMRHELTHQAVSNILREKEGDEYNWMHEGFAQMMANDPVVPDKAGKELVKRGGFIDLADMQSACRSDNSQTSYNGYYQSYNLCNYIADRYGMDTLIDIVKSPKPNFEEGFRDVTGDNFDDVYSDWKNSVTGEAD